MQCAAMFNLANKNRLCSMTCGIDNIIKKKKNTIKILYCSDHKVGANAFSHSIEIKRSCPMRH